MSYCCLMPREQSFRCIMARTSYSLMRWLWRLFCPNAKNAELDFVLKKQYTLYTGNEWLHILKKGHPYCNEKVVLYHKRRGLSWGGQFSNTVELVQSDTRVFRHPVTSAKNFGPTIFLLTKIKSEYSDILNNMTHPPGPLVCRVRQVLTSWTIWHIPLVP